MIPITVSYFMKHSDGDHKRTIKLATVYSVGIIATFSLLGMLLAVLFGAAGINLFAANPWVNLFIGALFLFFAFNLFGFYEISIPSSVLTRLDSITRSEEGKGSAYHRCSADGADVHADVVHMHVAVHRQSACVDRAGRLENAAARDARVLDRLRVCRSLFSRSLRGCCIRCRGPAAG